MKQNKDIVWHTASVTKAQRAQLKGQKPAILWFTGLSGSGKSTIANAVEAKLIDLGKHTYLLDGDNVRHGLNRGLSFSNEDRIENIRRIAEVAKLFVDAGTLVLTAFISPFQRERDLARHRVADGEFIEVFIDTPLTVCEQRDPKGLYDQARKGQIADFTGISSPYEAPKDPELTIHSADLSIDECANQVVRYLQKNGYLHQPKSERVKEKDGVNHAL